MARQGVLPHLHSKTFYALKTKWESDGFMGNRGGGGFIRYSYPPIDCGLDQSQDRTTVHWAGKSALGSGGGTLGRDASVYMYEGSEIRHALFLHLPLSTIIVAIFSLVNKNIDNNI